MLSSVMLDNTQARKVTKFVKIFEPYVQPRSVPSSLVQCDTDYIYIYLMFERNFNSLVSDEK